MLQRRGFVLTDTIYSTKIKDEIVTLTSMQQRNIYLPTSTF